MECIAKMVLLSKDQPNSTFRSKTTTRKCSSTTVDKIQIEEESYSGELAEIELGVSFS